MLTDLQDYDSYAKVELSSEGLFRLITKHGNLVTRINRLFERIVFTGISIISLKTHQSLSFEIESYEVFEKIKKDIEHFVPYLSTIRPIDKIDKIEIYAQKLTAVYINKKYYIAFSGSDIPSEVSHIKFTFSELK